MILYLLLLAVSLNKRAPEMVKKWGRDLSSSFKHILLRLKQTWECG